MRALALFSLLALAACATDDHAAGTETPAVTTPAEAPVEAAGDLKDVPADSATSLSYE